MEFAVSPILDDAEIAKRKDLLAGLQAALAESGIQCRLAGRQRLVLRYAEEPPHTPSGPTDPSLFVLGSASTVVTTDGHRFRLRNGRQVPVGDLAAVAAAIGH